MILNFAVSFSLSVDCLGKSELVLCSLLFAFDECLKMPIWTPSFILVRLLVLLISNV
jgi:hypothetical protein